MTKNEAPLRPQNAPKLSVISLNKNHGNYLQESLSSIDRQTFRDFELLVADGGSTDGSLALFDRYGFARILPGTDTSRDEGVLRAAAAATGDYLMFTTSTDGYLDDNWFATAVSALERDPEVSLVWGMAVTMRPDGSLGGSYPGAGVAMPGKRDWFLRWLFADGMSQAYLPELNYCVDRATFQRLLLKTPEFPELDEIDPVLRFLFRFNRDGYLTRYLPVEANFGRQHDGQNQVTPYIAQSERRYFGARARYRADLLAGRKRHVLRDRKGDPLAKERVGRGVLWVLAVRRAFHLARKWSRDRVKSLLSRR